MPTDVISERPSSDKTIKEVRIETQRTRGVDPSWELFETATSQMCRMRLEPSDGSIVFETNDGVGGGWIDAGSLGSGGGGDFVGPASSTDNAFLRFDSTTGKLGQNGQTTEDDSGNVSIVGTLSVGTSQTVSGTLASVTGGTGCSATGAYSHTGGGSNNDNNADYGFQGGGQNCSIAAGSDHSVLVGGNNCDITGTGDDCFLGGGISNSIDGGGIGGILVGGSTNVIVSGNYNFLGGGNLNSVTGANGFLGGGISNILSATQRAVLVGGSSNEVYANYSFLGGGQYCSIASSSSHSVLAGGNNNDITGTGDDCFIGGGVSNQITGTATSVTIAGGTGNANSGTSGTISGGDGNSVTATGATVSGGKDGTASGQYSHVPGGRECVASANHSSASGYGALSRALKGSRALAAEYASAAGDRQSREVTLNRQTTTDTFLSLTADGGSDSAGDIFQMPEDSLASLRWTVIGLKSDGSKAARYTVDALVKRYTSTTTLVWSNVTADHEDDATWDCQVATYSLGATVQAKGASGETVNWCAKLESVEIVN